MKKLFIAALFASQAALAFASDASNCSANGGTFMTGTVVKNPWFQYGSQQIDGIWLDHTHVSIRSDYDGYVYDVAMDNVYAYDYQENMTWIPPSLAALTVGTRLELCGKMYSTGNGIHWVHNNCNATPTTSDPDGWTKKIDSYGNVGYNREGSQAYCYLWN